MEHHPIADLFPMLAEDELKDLAADIAERGLLQPIVLDPEGRILDGRNRYAACELAGVEPVFDTFKGDDPDGYALAVNIARRHMTKAQMAMVIAGACNNYKLEDAKRWGVSQQYVSWARIVRKWANDRAAAVIDGAESLEAAYRVARANKDAVESEEAKLSELRKLAPDLAVFVENGLRGLADALHEAKCRRTVAEIDEARNADGAPPPSFAQRAEDGSVTWDEAVTLAEQWRTERAEAIERDQARIRNVLTGWGAIRTVINQSASPYVADVLNGLGETDRQQLDQITANWKG